MISYLYIRRLSKIGMIHKLITLSRSWLGKLETYASTKKNFESKRTDLRFLGATRPLKDVPTVLIVPLRTSVYRRWK